jgi:hypothetical protein
MITNYTVYDFDRSEDAFPTMREKSTIARHLQKRWDVSASASTVGCIITIRTEDTSRTEAAWAEIIRDCRERYKGAKRVRFIVMQESVGAETVSPRSDAQIPTM